MDRYELVHTLIRGPKVHYPGEVAPGWYLDLDGGLKGRLAAGAVRPTDKPLTGKYEAPEPKTDADPVPAMVLEANRLTEENAAFADSNKTLAAQNKALADQVDGLTRKLGAKEADIAQVERSAAEHRAKVESLAAELAEAKKHLDELTAPAPTK
jgi:predicted RNase H-like nuclease (RuvC/YqgF family)